MGSLDTGGTVPGEEALELGHEEPHGAGHGLAAELAARRRARAPTTASCPPPASSSASPARRRAGASSSPPASPGLAAGALSMAVGRVRLGEHPARHRAGAARQGAAGAARDARRGARRADRDLPRQGPVRRRRPRGRRAAHRPRRPRRARGGRARHQPRRAVQPLARGLRVAGGVHRRRAAAAARDRPAASGRPGAGDRRGRRAGAGLHRCGVSARLGHAPWRRPLVRNVAGGLLAMGITYGIGSLVGTAV